MNAINRKICRPEYFREYYLANKARISARNKEYRRAHREKIAAAKRAKYEENREAALAKMAQYRRDNQSKIRERKAAYYLKNKARVREKAAEAYRKNPALSVARTKAWRLANWKKYQAANVAYNVANRAKVKARRDAWNLRHPEAAAARLASPTYRVATALRTRVRKVLRGISKSDANHRLLGCSGPALVAHLEAKFQPGMSWKNYGLHGWHIDHVRPCASFDLTDPEQQKLCFHYTNLQPLWATDNLRKSARYEP